MRGARTFGWALPLAALVTVGIAAVPARVAAQSHSAMNLEVLAADDPRAKRAAGLVELLAAGDGPGAEAYLRANAAPGGKPLAPGGLQPILAGMSGGGYRVRDFGAMAGDMVVVRVVSPKGDPVMVALKMETAAPHRISEVQLVRLQHD